MPKYLFSKCYIWRFRIFYGFLSMWYKSWPLQRLHFFILSVWNSNKILTFQHRITGGFTSGEGLKSVCVAAASSVGECIAHPREKVVIPHLLTWQLAPLSSIQRLLARCWRHVYNTCIKILTFLEEYPESRGIVTIVQHHADNIVIFTAIQQKVNL